MARNRLNIFLFFLGLVLLGTVIVLSSTAYYLAISPAAYLSESSLPPLRPHERWNASAHGQTERIPRILHQTWRVETLPQRWRGISQECRDMMPDYEYMLWTDESSQKLIADHYPWFLDTFVGYKYNIQRADAIRYFVLYHYGGVYLDLDIGCLRPLDPLLMYPVILPKTIPVGISNDLIFSEKGHPFLEQAIHNLATFDHSWILNYPTVMFSTGPMFLSIQYVIFSSSQASSRNDPIRILPKALYGKNAKEGEVPHSFFSHFYGSSWHADDAGFIGFLGTWGTWVMRIMAVVLVLGLIKLMLPGRQRRGLRRYDVLFPRWSHRTGSWTFHLGRTALSSSSSSTSPSSPLESLPDSPISSDVPLLHLPFDMQPASPISADSSASDQFAGRTTNPLVDAYRRVRNRVASIAGTPEQPRTPMRPRRHRYSRGVLFFLPAIFTQPPDIELGPNSAGAFPRDNAPPVPLLSRPPATRSNSIEKRRLTEGLVDDHSLVETKNEDLLDASPPQDGAWSWNNTIPRTRGLTHTRDPS